MSIGELINLYRDDELIINPEYQRLFRWNQTAKTRFIESLLLGIPIPPIFVFQDEFGIWELIDGLQRLSTVFQFIGILEGEKADELGPLILEGTNYLPSLANKRWERTSEEVDDGIGLAQQLQIKRARIRVEILKKESDNKAKYELFQRLNTGGSRLTEQEVRNCIAVMINPQFHAWLMGLATNELFIEATAQTDTALEGQAGVELALRFLAYLNVPYERGLDVHEYLDAAIIHLAGEQGTDFAREQERFVDTFSIIYDALGTSAFKRWDGASFRGKFLISVYEVLAPGVAQNIDALKALGENEAKEFIMQRAKELWANPIFQANSGGGTRGTTRLVNLLPMSAEFMRP
jgi:hypothetical protein